MYVCISIIYIKIDDFFSSTLGKKLRENEKTKKTLPYDRTTYFQFIHGGFQYMYINKNINACSYYDAIIFSIVLITRLKYQNALKCIRTLAQSLVVT